MVGSNVMRWFLVVGVSVMCASVDGAGPTATPPKVGKVPVHPLPPPPKPRSVNTHVRGPAAAGDTTRAKGTVSKPGTTGTPKKTTIVHVTPGRHRIVAHPRHVVRHLSGSVLGYVSSGGEPVGGARVALRGAKGKAFRSASRRHVVYTEPGGTFLMRRVRVGRYRVVASKSGAGSGHAQLAFHTSGTHRVEVRLAGKHK